MVRCRCCEQDLPESDFFPSWLKHQNYVCKLCLKIGQDEVKKQKKAEYERILSTVGGWKIVFLNYVKKGEYRFQALNTDGRFYQTNDPIEIYSILEDIFANLCEENKK